MKHRRGIDLVTEQPPSIVGMAEELSWLSFEKLAEWHVLGGRCARCERDVWVDRWELQARFGKQCYLYKLSPRLRCRKCGNKGNNKWIIGKLSR